MEQYKFSIITPEHNPDNTQFLLELYESICNQTYPNWEWVLFLNGNCSEEHIPEIIKHDQRVVIHKRVKQDGIIGAIKKEAFSLGSGDILVEADHDDMLTTDCLEELNKAYQNQSIGFVYSDDAFLHMVGESIPFTSENGWTYKMFKWKDKELLSMNSFPPSSYSFSYIWYAPDHVRSWRKSTYHEIGGHNENMNVCDDHELCIRSYLATETHFIPKVLYIYRITGNNTSINHRNAEIQETTKNLHNQYAQRLAERDAEIRQLFKVDISSSSNHYPGYERINVKETENNLIPLPDNCVGVLNATHVIQCVKDKHKIISEIHRVLAPGGWAFIEVPSTDGRGAYQDPTHISYWNENCFLYYTDSHLGDFIGNKTIRFQTYRLETHFPNDWLKSINVSMVSAWLVAIKPGMGRIPGQLKI